MGRLIAAINITCDGFMARQDGNLDWHFTYWDNQLCESLSKQLAQATAILLGRNTYIAMANYWMPTRNSITHAREDLVLSELLNRTQKVVVSKTLKTPEWQQTSLIGHKLTNEIRLLQSRSAKDIVILGSIKLVTSLAKLKLIDGYELWVHPIAIKNGIALFGSITNETELILTSTETLQSGIVHLSYKVDHIR